MLSKIKVVLFRWIQLLKKSYFYRRIFEISIVHFENTKLFISLVPFQLLKGRELKKKKNKRKRFFDRISQLCFCGGTAVALLVFNSEHTRRYYCYLCMYFANKPSNARCRSDEPKTLTEQPYRTENIVAAVPFEWIDVLDNPTTCDMTGSL